MRVTETNKNGNPIIGPDLYEGNVCFNIYSYS